jgi:hypothetical protein
MTLWIDTFDNEVEYGVTILLVRKMLTAGIVDRYEFAKIEQMQTTRYRPVFLHKLDGCHSVKKPPIP